MDDFNRYCKFQVKLGEIILLRVEVCNRYVRFAALRSLMKYLQNCI